MKPLTIKISGEFEVKETVSLKELTNTVADVQKAFQDRLGTGTLLVKIGRQEYRV